MRQTCDFNDVRKSTISSQHAFCFQHQQQHRSPSSADHAAETDPSDGNPDTVATRIPAKIRQRCLSQSRNPSGRDWFRSGPVRAFAVGNERLRLQLLYRKLPQEQGTWNQQLPGTNSIKNFFAVTYVVISKERVYEAFVEFTKWFICVRRISPFVIVQTLKWLIAYNIVLIQLQKCQLQQKKFYSYGPRCQNLLTTDDSAASFHFSTCRNRVAKSEFESERSQLPHP